MNRSKIVAGDLIGTEQNYAVKGRSIQNNLHFVLNIIEEIEDDNEASWIHLDQSKAFHRINHRFLAAVLGIARFEPEFSWWISILYQSPTVQMKRKCSGPFAIESESGRASLCLHFSMPSLWSPCSAGLGMRGLVQSCAESHSLAISRRGWPHALMT